MRKVSKAFSKSAATKSVSNVWVEGGGAEGSGDRHGPGEAVDSDGPITKGGHYVGRGRRRSRGGSGIGLPGR